MRLDWDTILVSLAGLPFIAPHVVEDFADGIAQRVGLSTGVGAFLLGGWLGLQSLGLILLACGRAGGWLMTFMLSLVWATVALLDHGPALMHGTFRTGLPSVIWVVGLIVTQGVAAAFAWRGWRRARIG